MSQFEPLDPKKLAGLSMAAGRGPWRPFAYVVPLIEFKVAPDEIADATREARCAIYKAKGRTK